MVASSQLKEFVAASLRKGYSLREVAQGLQQRGVSSADVLQVLEELEEEKGVKKERSWAVVTILSLLILALLAGLFIVLFSPLEEESTCQSDADCSSGEECISGGCYQLYALERCRVVVENGEESYSCS